MSETMNLNMEAAAQAVGLSYERFRKVWPTLCQAEGFPAPIHGRKWDAAAVAAWRKARSERNVVAFLRPPEPPPPADQGRRARQALATLRQA